MGDLPSGKHAVRPTRRALNEMGLRLPTLEVLLHELDDKHVQAMQEVPARALAQGMERVKKIADRHWLKYKSSNVRAVVTKLGEAEIWPSVSEHPLLGRWWIGAFGHRQADSAHRDFYGLLPTDSDGLLPGDWDQRRLTAELATVLVRSIRETVIVAIAMSMRRGKPVHATAADHYIQALVRAPERDEAYLVLGAGGIYDEDIVAIILDSVPGIPRDDWQMEPSENLGIKPFGGEVVWSTMLPPDVQANVVQLADAIADEVDANES